MIPFTAFLEKNKKRFGSIYGAYDFNKKIFVVNNIELARDISIKHFNNFRVRNSAYFGPSNLAKSLFFLPAKQDWKRIRSIVTPAFTTGKLKDMCKPIGRIVNNFVDNLRQHAESGEEFDIKNNLSGFTMDVIASCGYGINVDSVRQPNHPIVENAKRILAVDASFTFIFTMTMNKLAEWLKMEAFNKQSINYFDRLTHEIIDKRLESPDSSCKSAKSI